VLSDVVEAVRIAAVLLIPVMPASCAEILRRMGEDRAADELRLDRDAAWSGARERVITKGDPLWPRLETAAAVTDEAASRPEEKTMTDQPAARPPVTADAPPAPPAAAEGLAAPPAPPAAAVPTDERIPIDDFVKIDLRVAKILAAEKVKGSRKLIKMQVDAGAEPRTLVAGIAEAYEPDALVGRSVVIVANLKPAKLMGIESNGMVLAASPEGGLPVLLGFDNPPPPGSRVK
jgi:methionyl-tRNA synthetase